jgi:t-SNARE complex subunit (syntaxin)
MRAERENVKLQSRAPTSSGFRSRAPARAVSPAPAVDSQFELALEREHQSLTNELLESHAMIVQTQAIGEEIANLHRIYNAMVAEQTEKIRVIRQEVEDAADSYTKGDQEIHKAADRSKFQHLWISIVIYVMALMLLFKQLQRDL